MEVIASSRVPVAWGRIGIETTACRRIWNIDEWPALLANGDASLLRSWPPKKCTNRMTTSKSTGVEDVVVSMATRVGVLVAGVAIQSLLAYALLPAGRGEFAVCIMFAALVGVLFTPGADAGSQYFVMGKDINVSQGVIVSLAICLGGAVVAAALAIPLIQSNITFFQKAERASFHVTLALLPLTAFSNAVQHQLAGLRRFKTLALFSLVQTAANGLALVLLVLVLQLGVVGALFSVCLSNLTMILVCVRDLRRHFGLKPEFPVWAALRRVLQYGFRYYVARIGWGIDLRIGILLLSLFAGRAEIGLFAVASGLMMRFVMISNAVFAPLLPRTTSHSSGRPDLVAFCARITTWITGATLILFLATHVPLIRILLSDEFLPAASLIRIITPGILVFAGGNILTAYFRGVGRPEICSWAVALGLCLNLVVLPALYPTIGVEAAAWAMSAGLFGRSALLSIVYVRMTRTSLHLSWVPQRGDIQRVSVLVLTEIRRRSNHSPIHASSGN